MSDKSADEQFELALDDQRTPMPTRGWTPPSDPADDHFVPEKRPAPDPDQFVVDL